mgnify:CR=1 FL=1
MLTCLSALVAIRSFIIMVLAIPNLSVRHIVCNYFHLQDHITIPSDLPTLCILEDEFRFLPILHEVLASAVRASAENLQLL